MVLCWLLTLLRKMLSLMGFGSLASRALSDQYVPGSLQVFVRTNTGRKILLSLRPEWKVLEVKRQLSLKLSLPVSSIRLVFAGHELGDSVVVGDCDIGQQSVLHAIQVDVDRDVPSEQDAAPMNQTLLDLRLSDEEKSRLTSVDERVKHRAHFYVFCSSPCHSLQPGKLRVKCSTCSEGAIVVHREPCSWRDVLEAGRIEGTCRSGKCVATVPQPITFFFKCASHPGVTDDDISPPLSLVKSNANEIPCLACLSSDCDPVVVFDCRDRHVICVECFRNYCLARLNERQFVLDPDLGYTLPCPIGCEDSLIAEVRHFRLMGDSDYERYQRFGAEECVLQAGGVLCPQPNCGMGIIQDEPCRKVTCFSGCGYVFCRDCQQGYHIGECQQAVANCVEADNRPGSSAVFSGGDRARWFDGSVDPSSVAIRITTKPCPKCRVPTERDGGCMHMVCTKTACGFHWCWICQTEWTRECMASHWFG